MITMTRRTADFELGTTGNNVLPADAGSITAWDDDNVTGTGAKTYDTTHANRGTKACKWVMGATDTGYLAWNQPLQSGLSGVEKPLSHYTRFYVYFTSNPTNTFTLHRTINISQQCGGLQMNSSRQLIIVDSAGTAQRTFTQPIATNAWVRIETHYSHDPTNGIIEVRFFNDDTLPLPTEYQKVTGINTQAGWDRIRFGPETAPGSITFWMDDCTACAFTWPGRANTARNSCEVPAGIIVDRNVSNGWNSTPQAPNTSGPNSDPFDYFAADTGAILTSDATHALDGCAWMIDSHALAPATAECDLGWWDQTIGQVSQVWFRAYYYFTRLPNTSSNTVWRIGRCGTSSNGALIEISNSFATNALNLKDAAGTSQAHGTTAFVLNQWIRLEWTVIRSATVGFIEAKLFLTPDSTVPSETVSTAANLNTGTGLITSTLFGSAFDTTADEGPYWMDYIEINTYSYPGPFRGIRSFYDA